MMTARSARETDRLLYAGEADRPGRRNSRGGTAPTRRHSGIVYSRASRTGSPTTASRGAERLVWLRGVSECPGDLL